MPGKRIEEMVCYCFGYTVGEIAREVEESGSSSIMERIMAAKRAGGCNCAERNPTGR